MEPLLVPEEHLAHSLEGQSVIRASVPGGLQNWSCGDSGRQVVGHRARSGVSCAHRNADGRGREREDRDKVQGRASS